MGLTLSSCQEIAIIKYSIDDAKQQAEIRKITSPYYEKEGGWAYQANKEVLDIVKEVLKRPISILIPPLPISSLRYIGV